MSTDTRLIHAVPASMPTQPATARVPVPSIVREVNAAAANAAAVTGKKATPASSGL